MSMRGRRGSGGAAALLFREKIVFNDRIQTIEPLAAAVIENPPRAEFNSTLGLEFGLTYPGDSEARNWQYLP